MKKDEKQKKQKEMQCKTANRKPYNIVAFNLKFIVFSPQPLFADKLSSSSVVSAYALIIFHFSSFFFGPVFFSPRSFRLRIPNGAKARSPFSVLLLMFSRISA